MNSVMASFITTVGQMTEMSQRKEKPSVTHKLLQQCLII